MDSKTILKYSIYCTKVDMECFVLLVDTFFEAACQKRMYPSILSTSRKLLNLLRTSSQCPVLPNPTRKNEKKENK